VKWRLLFANRARTLRRNLSAGARLRALLVRPVPLPGLRGAIHELGPWRTLRAAALGGWDLLSSIPEDRAVRRAGPLLTRLPG
jgi:hypothetical protein